MGTNVVHMINMQNSYYYLDISKKYFRSRRIECTGECIFELEIEQNNMTMCNVW